MGYELYITRQDNWFDDNIQKKISLEEWISYISKDSEMRLDNFAQIELPNKEIFRIEKEGIAVWEEYSGEGKGQNQAWFTYYNGNVQVKNPDQEIINKMVVIAIFFALDRQSVGNSSEIRREFIGRPSSFGRLPFVFHSLFFRYSFGLRSEAGDDQKSGCPKLVLNGHSHPGN